MTTSPSNAKAPRPPWLHTAEVAKPGDWLPEVQREARKSATTLLPVDRVTQAVPAVPDSGRPDTVDLVNELRRRNGELRSCLRDFMAEYLDAGGDRDHYLYQWAESLTD